jgi:uncharacterized Ntn-hydrolase superfamily protein
MGVAVQSHYFSVGSAVSWGEAGIGVVATQSIANLNFGPHGLSYLEQGISPDKVLSLLLERDESSEYRQAACCNAIGELAVHTGTSCIPEAGHVQGRDFTVQANMMLKDSVWPAMAEVFDRTDGSLAERMLAALYAAEEEGGDIRGKQSAAMLIVKTFETGSVENDRVLELRVEDHPHPLKELDRLLSLHNAYQKLSIGDEELGKGNKSEALEAYEEALRLAPDNEEVKYWYAVSLANTGDLTTAADHLQEIYARNSRWRELTRRLPGCGLLNGGKDILDSLL